MIIGWNTGVTNSTKLITFGTTEASCLQSKLPSGGGTSVLPTGSVTCATATGNSYVKNGKFNNNLLGNTISLSLATRGDVTLATMPITNTYFSTHAATSCINGKAIPGTKLTYPIPANVLTALNANAAANGGNTVAGLLYLANKTIGGVNGMPSLSDMNTAVSSIVQGFSQCRILGGFASTSAGYKLADQETADQDVEVVSDVVVYPNPTTGDAYVKYEKSAAGTTLIQVCNVQGSVVYSFATEQLPAGVTYNMRIPSATWAEGVYIIKLQQGENISIGKLIILRH
jgi:hypothetical protein